MRVRLPNKSKSNNYTESCMINEAMLRKDNFNKEYKRVKANKGTSGIDGMTIEEALPYLQEYPQELTDRIYCWKPGKNETE